MKQTVDKEVAEIVGERFAVTLRFGARRDEINQNFPVAWRLPRPWWGEGEGENVGGLIPAAIKAVERARTAWADEGETHFGGGTFSKYLSGDGRVREARRRRPSEVFDS